MTRFNYNGVRSRNPFPKTSTPGYIILWDQAQKYPPPSQTALTADPRFSNPNPTTKAAIRSWSTRDKLDGNVDVPWPFHGHLTPPASSISLEICSCFLFPIYFRAHLVMVLPIIPGTFSPSGRTSSTSCLAAVIPLGTAYAHYRMYINRYIGSI